jgi:WD40 repeat protein
VIDLTADTDEENVRLSSKLPTRKNGSEGHASPLLLDQRGPLVESMPSDTPIQVRQSIESARHASLKKTPGNGSSKIATQLRNKSGSKIDTGYRTPNSEILRRYQEHKVVHDRNPSTPNRNTAATVPGSFVQHKTHLKSTTTPAPSTRKSVAEQSTVSLKRKLIAEDVSRLRNERPDKRVTAHYPPPAAKASFHLSSSSSRPLIVTKESSRHRNLTVNPSTLETYQSSKSLSAGSSGEPFTAEEDAKIIKYKEKHNWTWREIQTRLPHRSAGSIQNRYSRKLQTRSASNLASSNSSSLAERSPQLSALGDNTIKRQPKNSTYVALDKHGLSTAQKRTLEELSDDGADADAVGCFFAFRNLSKLRDGTNAETNVRSEENPNTLFLDDFSLRLSKQEPSSVVSHNLNITNQSKVPKTGLSTDSSLLPLQNFHKPTALASLGIKSKSISGKKDLTRTVESIPRQSPSARSLSSSSLKDPSSANLHAHRAVSSHSQHVPSHLGRTNFKTLAPTDLALTGPTHIHRTEDDAELSGRMDVALDRATTTLNEVIIGDIGEHSGFQHLARNGAESAPRTLQSNNSTSSPNQAICRPLQIVHIPYLSSNSRKLIGDSFIDGRWDARYGLKWANAIIHRDFQEDEVKAVEKSILRVLGFNEIPRTSKTSRRIGIMLDDATEDQVLAIAADIEKGKTIPSRSSEDIREYLWDVVSDTRSIKPQMYQIGPVKHVVQRKIPQQTDINMLLRCRELGSTFRRNKMTLKNYVYDSFGPVMSYTGTSGDVNCIAWSPSGRMFGVGAIALDDEASMQYNMPRNLLLGDVDKSTLLELPDHHVPRQKTAHGANSTHAMHVSQDPRLFKTISGVEFSPCGQYMFSTGYDNMMRIWDVTDPKNPRCAADANFGAKAYHLAVSCNGLVATGSARNNQKFRDPNGHAVTGCSWSQGHVLDQNGRVLEGYRRDPDKSIRIFKPTGNSNRPYEAGAAFFSERAIAKKESETYPCSLKFDPTGRLLLAGFSAHAAGSDRQYGEFCLWDMQTEKALPVAASARQIFDGTWSNIRPGEFAIGTVAQGNVNKGCRSVIRLYDWQYSSQSMGWKIELECPALDMNDIVLWYVLFFEIVRWPRTEVSSPYDENYVAAGCTDGKIYVWDIRMPDRGLFNLCHGAPLQPFSQDQPLEELDSGVGFCSWGENRTRLYTGSSDGVVKVWDITQAYPYVKDILTLDSGVICGSFSPGDKSSLLLGEVNGSVTLLDVGRADKALKDVPKFQLIDADPVTYYTDMPIELEQCNESSVDSGVAAAKASLKKGELQIRRLGNLPIRQAVQGPKYHGPYDSAPDAVALRRDAIAFQQRMANITSNECTIPECASSTALLSYEEQGDSGRSVDRIPDQLRKETGTTLKGTFKPGYVKCTSCEAPARMRVSEGAQDNEHLCERCDFSCFRCGNRAVVSKESDVVWCLHCGIDWAIGALGYRVLRKRKDATWMDVDGKSSFQRQVVAADPSLSKVLEAQLQDELDEVEDLANYYHSLWIDRPKSPF